MDLERPHRSTSLSSSSSTTNNNNSTTTTTSELFICFTSRLSSSSMKINSKSILSPGRAREPSQISLSTSLSRRLKSNGSMKGGQASPMFTTNGKKRGCAFENPEPSSPKVTCIGQVRVKTKKQGKKFRARSKRREVSFRRVDHNGGAGSSSLDSGNYQDYDMGRFLSSSSHRQQQQECKKWVHLPVTICEALRTFGAEFNCFLPCRSSCMASQREKEEKAAGSGENGSSCGAVFARWLVAVQEDEGKQREIELVVGEDERRESMEMRSSQRRHVFEDIEIDDINNENAGEEEARVSTCIPPKNALLLMRCRSDPLRMAALANRFWEPPLPDDEGGIENKEDDGEEKEEVEEDVKVEEEQGRVEQEMEHEESEVSEKFGSCEATEDHEIPEAEAEAEADVESALDTEQAEEASQGRCFTVNETENEAQQDELKEETEELAEDSSAEAPPDLEKPDEGIPPDPVQEFQGNLDPEPEPEPEVDIDKLKETTSKEEEFRENVKEKGEENSQSTAEPEAEAAEDSTSETEEEETEKTQAPRVPESKLGPLMTREPDPGYGAKARENPEKLLPDCLLLMMCEPKLSMEVSKETWVCSTDFIKWLPERRLPAVKKKDGKDEPKRRISIDSNPAHQLLIQPPRSSCSFPAPPPMLVARGLGGGATGTVEQKLVSGGKGYEPFVLKRCKSEPMRSSAKLAPDACCWKNRKLEPATLGVGAAGVGF